MNKHSYKKGDKVIVINNKHHKNLVVGDTYTIQHVSNTLLGCLPCKNKDGYNAISITECISYERNPFKNMPLFRGLTV